MKIFCHGYASLFAWATGVLFALAALWAWFFSPLDYQHKELVRILYVHVPSSWLALGLFAMMGLFAMIGVVGKIPVAQIMVQTLCPIGFVFALLSLATGSLWGRPAWGTWWVWDARLTSMAFLCFQYWGTLAIQRGFRDGRRGLHLSCFFVLMGLINLPIIKWSVSWWATLHQPSGILQPQSSLDHQFMGPLFSMALASAAYVLWMVCVTLPKNIQRYGRSLGQEAKIQAYP